MTSSICANWPPSHRIRRGAPLPAPIWFQGPNHEVSRAVSRRRLTFQLSARNLIRSQRAVKLKMNAYCDSGEERILSALGLAQNDRLDPDMIQARLKVFGSENVDPRTGEIQKNKVVMSWLTHTTHGDRNTGSSDPDKHSCMFVARADLPRWFRLPRLLRPPLRPLLFVRHARERAQALAV